MNTYLRGKLGIAPDKRFVRFHKPFRDAVQSGELSAVVEVLLRAQLSGDNARRTAQKILDDQTHGSDWG